MSNSQLSFNFFDGYFIIIITCLILVQTQTVTAESNKDMVNGDQCCSTEKTSSHSSDKNRTFTEKFIAKRAGRNVDLKKLLVNYSSICPLQDSCGVDIDKMFLFPGEIVPAITGCYRCSCYRFCIVNGNCCPGTHYGYFNYRFINMNLYPKKNDTSYNFTMIGTCLDRYNENKTIIELCRGKVEPCIGIESMLYYRNKYCGICNKELDCSPPWNIKVECKNDTKFESDLISFSSPIDMKKALDLNNCRIKFQIPPSNRLGFERSHRNADYLCKARVDRCNVSGFWETYDEDIDWACANFIAPYKHFKNVFCYICNPSQASMQAVSLIDKCRPARNNFESDVNKACESFQVSDRLAPFKNIYCYMCSQGDKLLFNENKYSLQYMKEENTLTLQTRLDTAITFSSEHNIKEFKAFVQDAFAEHFEVTVQGTIPNNPTKLDYDPSDLNEIIEGYTTVCGTRTLCNVNIDRNNTGKLYGNPVCKTCTCDTICAENESCCPDILFNREPYSCLNPRMFPSFYKYEREGLKWSQNICSGTFMPDFYKTIDICLNESTTHSTNEKCSVYNDTFDRLSLIPVSTETGMTYKNIDGYKCNNNNKSPIILKFQVVCKTYIEHTLFINIEDLLMVIKHYCAEISFVPGKNKLCLDRYDSAKASRRQGEMFIRRKLHPSQFQFRVQVTQVLHGVPFGKLVFDKTVFDRCNITGLYRNVKSDLVTDICETEDVNLMSLHEYRIGNNVYKNFACFLCNPEYDLFIMNSDKVMSRCLSKDSVEWYEPDETLEELCNETEFHSRWYPHKNMYCAECNLPPWQLIDLTVHYSGILPAAGYKYIFSLSWADFEHLDEIMETEAIPYCTSGSYDYATKTCRQLSCSDGFQLFNTTCKPVLEFAVRRNYSLSFGLRYSAEERINISDSNEINMTLTVNFQTLCSKIIDNITNLLGETTEYHVTSKDCQASPCLSFYKTRFEKIYSVDLVLIDSFRIHLNILIIKTEAISIVHTALQNALNRQFYFSDFHDLQGLPQSFRMQSTPIIKKNTDSLDLMGCTDFQFFADPNVDSLRFRHYTIDVFFTCAQVKLNTSEVCLHIDTNNISLKNRNVTFSVSEYKIEDKHVIICADVYSKRTFIEPGVILVIRTDPVKSVFIVYSFICTVVSLLCLFLTFLTYCFISSLRTIAGKNIMALCISLFFSQALLQFGINAKQITTLCVAIGISVNLFWLVSFCAMNTCSFHTFKVFYYNDFENRNVTKRSDNVLFLKYSIYMICLPVFMVLVTISASVIKSAASDIGYGRYYCFISNFYIFLFTFITPACLLFVSNIVFFSMAFHKIRTSPNVPGARDRNNLYICLRLCTIVGIAWPLLIIDSSLGLTWFSFIVAGVNSLQGVLIFVSFVLNRRIASIFVSTMMEKL